MTAETLPIQQNDSLPSQDQQRQLSTMTGNRDRFLYNALGPDYTYASDTGLFNQFYFNDETGADGIMHILGGDYLIAGDDTIIPRGFHHAPSGADTWGEDSEGKPLTYVTDEHLPTKARELKHYRKAPYNPYKSHVVVGGHIKKSFDKDPKTGEEIVVHTKNGMFPDEYDALTVLRGIVIARDGRDESKDEIDLNQEVITNIGEIPMIDGKHKMEVKLILDAHSKKIISAFPLAPKTQVNFTRDEIKQHLGLKNER